MEVLKDERKSQSGTVASNSVQFIKVSLLQANAFKMLLQYKGPLS